MELALGLFVKFDRKQFPKNMVIINFIEIVPGEKFTFKPIFKVNSAAAPNLKEGDYISLFEDLPSKTNIPVESPEYPQKPTHVVKKILHQFYGNGNTNGHFGVGVVVAPLSLAKKLGDDFSIDF